MARTVFILGAGASAELGAPTISTFMRAIRDVEGTPGILEYKNDFSAVLQGYRLLQPAYAKMRMNYENDIEELFATFETARILGETVLGNIDPGELSRSMKRVIASTIEEKMRFSLGSRSDYGAVVFPHRQYIDFARLLRGLHTSGRSDSSVAILTFNYDVGLDQALEHFLIPFSYGFESNSNANTIPYLKLHGSLNWGVCRRCKKNNSS